MLNLTRLAVVPLFATLAAAPAVAIDKPADKPSENTAEAVPPPPAAAAPAKERDGLPLVFHEDFKDAETAFAKFDLLDPTDWKMEKVGDRNVISLFKKPTDASSGKLPVRSPFGRAIVKDLYVSEFVLEARFRSTVKPYDHQDLCLFFGEVDPTHLYYVHFGKRPDPNAGNIFIVNGTPRKNLLPPHDKAVPWTEGWHSATVTRKADGSIAVTFDGKPYLSVTDRTFPAGRVGVGSFDDTGVFAEVTVWGKVAEKPAPFPPTTKPAEEPKAKADQKPAK